MDTVISVNSTLLHGLRRLIERPRDFIPALPEARTYSWAALVLGAMWLIIGLVGALDTYLTVRFRAVMYAVEENPVGRFLIRCDGGDVSLFVGVKVAGTILALGILGWVATNTRKSFAFAVMAPVALAQLTLVYYLLG